MSSNSMKNIKSDYLKPHKSFLDHFCIEHIENSTPAIKIQQPATIKTTHLEPSYEKPVVAIDVSSIKIGETKSGEICAVRGAIVWKEKCGYNYQRIGPFPFHITEHNRKEICKIFRNNEFGFSEIRNSINIQNRIGNLLER